MRTRTTAVLMAGLLLAVAGFFALSDGRQATANPLAGIVAIEAGESMTCAIIDGGGVKCWGTRVPFPADVDAGGSAVMLGSGNDHTCAILESRSVRCWGREVPQAEPSLPGPAIATDGGSFHTCALIEGGMVSCWGDNGDGQVGVVDAMCSYWTPCSHPPTQVEGVAEAVAIGVGTDHSCAALSDGGVMCWGRNHAGQLGDGTGLGRGSAEPVLNISNAIAVVAGDAHSCALTDEGSVRCWGLSFGNSPQDVAGLETDVLSITTSGSHTCALRTTGTVSCWGANSFGQLGDGQRCGATVCTAPVDVLGLDDDVVDVTAGSLYTCVVLSSGTAKCWGNNYGGQLGNGETERFRYSTVPVDVAEFARKPAPTPAPCEGPCPTVVPRPTAPTTGLDFSLGIDANDDGLVDCGTATGQVPYCMLEMDSEFRAMVRLHAVSPTTSKYAGFDAAISFLGVTSKQKSDTVWPDCGFPATHYASNFIALGCAAPLGDVTSSYVGVMGQSLFTCSSSGSLTLLHGNEGTGLVPRSLYTEHEASQDEMLPVTCGEPLAGDVDCSVLVTSVDAQLTLQIDASLLESAACEHLSDVNLDKATNSVDSLITLQYVAGFVAGLPVIPGE